MVLSHRAGLAAVRWDLPQGAMYDWELMTGALAEQEPWWLPDSGHGYHVMTFGFLVGEIVRRVSGERIGAFFEREVAAPLDADVRFGTAAGDDARTADYVSSRETHPGAGADVPLLQARAYLNPPGIGGRGTVNTRAWRAAEMPSTSIHATARGIARVYSALACGGAVDGVHILLPATIDAATVEASSGIDLVLGRPSRFGLGFQLTQPERPFGSSPRSFGHFGAGGSVGFADPDARLAFAYALNRGGSRWQNPRNRALIDALYELL
jgi:CubicO group peptidase (beta-lactamase class C family)